jgi:hypothetical protein
VVTLSQLYAEYRARAKKLKESVDRGFRDCIPAERACLAEIEHELVTKLLSVDVGDQLMATAGDLELGALSTGLSLAHSRSYT